MNSDAAKAFQHETEFLSGVEGNFEAAKGKQLRGSIWKTSHFDETDRLKALLASNRIFDREKLKSLPANRCVVLQGFERRWIIGKRATGVAIASVLSPMSHFASNDDSEAKPIGLGELVDHVRRLTRRSKATHLIGVCCPTGLTQEAKNARLDLPGVTVVLVEPDGQGGWNTFPCGDDTDPRVLKIFDPEQAKDKVDRVRRMVEERSADLLTGGLSVSSVANKMALPQDVVQQAFQQVADQDPELRVAKSEGEFLLFRGAMVQPQERKAMNVVDRIKQLFASDGGEAEKVNLLAERRALLAQRRDRIYEDIGGLEKREADLLAQGKAATSNVPKRRLAAQLAQLRKDIARQNTTAAMLNKQIDIISTDIHNLTLIQQGEMASLPDTEELTQNAVRAEEMLETLQADADLVGSLETGIEETLASDDELAILKEFDEEKTPPEVAAPSKVAQATPPPKQVDPPEPTKPAAEDLPTPPTDEKSRRADAEPN